MANGFGEGVSLAYDATTGSYTVSDANGASASFLPETRSPGESTTTVSVYNTGSSGTLDKLALFNPGAGNPSLQLSYVSYGAWRHSVSNGTGIDHSFQYFVYGIRQDANQPSTGSGSYAIQVDGTWSNPDGIYLLSSPSGSSTFTADFSNKTVTTTLQLRGTNSTAPGGGIKSLGRFDGTGTIAALGGGFSGSFTQSGTDGNGNVYTGGFAGAFFGPHGEEMGYTFQLTSPTGGTAAGAVVGKAN
jgi:hypothetical protein